MSNLTRDDLRAAVAKGTLSEAQAASVLALAEERAGVRSRISGLDEPFELFRGFNEIFIVVGLGILFAGWMGVTGLSFLLNTQGYLNGFAYGSAGIVAIFFLARYFTLKRRMVAPSIALAIMFALCSVQTGQALAALLDLFFQDAISVIFAFATIASLVYYYVFRVPFTMVLIAIGVAVTVFATLVDPTDFARSDVADLFLLSADGSFALITIVLGLIGLCAAIAFDMSDPHRVTRRAASGFWLHVVSAPAIVNTVALTLFQNDTVVGQLALAGFIALVALFAIVIDRRSFLIAAVGYIVALAFSVFGGADAEFFVILALGLALVWLGAKWEALRSAIMRALPDFPGKTRLPQWNNNEEALQ